MRADVIIPSNKKFQELCMYAKMYEKLYFTEGEVNFIPTGLQSSASINRNFGLLRSQESDAEYVIMMDDDVGGFFTGWHNLLIQPLKDYEDISLVSARLITPEGEFSPMMGVGYDMSKEFTVAAKIILSACIAFRKKDILGKLWFDMEFVGSGFEDTLFTYQLGKLYPEKRFVVNNNCKLIHYHEMKNQGGKHFQWNKKVFLEKCGDINICNMVKNMEAYCV